MNLFVSLIDHNGKMSSPLTPNHTHTQNGFQYNHSLVPGFGSKRLIVNLDLRNRERHVSEWIFVLKEKFVEVSQNKHLR